VYTHTCTCTIVSLLIPCFLLQREQREREQSLQELEEAKELLHKEKTKGERTIPSRTGRTERTFA
jgi:preprotein translocase subunit YajC